MQHLNKASQVVLKDKLPLVKVIPQNSESPVRLALVFNPFMAVVLFWSCLFNPFIFHGSST